MDRAQAHTLEAFVAALILVSGIIFATQATAVTPLSASTSNQHIENQQQTVASDLLAAADENGTLRDAIVYWNNTSAGNESFGGIESEDRSFYTDDPPPDNPLGDPLRIAFNETQIAYNIELVYLSAWNETDVQPMVAMGTPSDNAITVSRTILLFDDTNLTYPGGNQGPLGETNGTFYAPDVGDEVDTNALYNVVEVRITVWRM